MDGLDGLMLRKARAVLQRCVPHRTSSVDWQVRVAAEEFELGGPACQGWPGATQQNGAAAGPLNAESPPVGGLSAIRRSGGFRGKGTFR